MAEVKVKCPYCGSEEISLYGKKRQGQAKIFMQKQTMQKKNVYT